MINKIRSKVISSIIDNPKRYLLITFAFMLVILPGIGLIGEDYSYRAWYQPQDPLLQRYDEFERKFGNDDSAIIILYSEKGLLNSESLKKIYNITDEMWLVKYITRVDSLTNYDYMGIDQEDQLNIGPLVNEEDLENIDDNFINELRRKINENSLIQEVYISKDEKLAMIKSQVISSFVQLADNQVIADSLRDIMKKYSDDDHIMYLGGTAVITNFYKEISEKDMALLLPLLYLFFTIVLIFIYKTKTGVFLPYAILTASIALMMGCAGYLGEVLNSLSAAAPNILMTVAIADAVHLLTVFYLGLKKSLNRDEALRYSLEKNFYPTILTSLTTAVGFFSFAGAKISAVSMMGMQVGLGVIIAWLLTYFFLAPIIKLIPGRIPKSSKKKKDENKIEMSFKIPESFYNRVSLIRKFRYPIVIITLILSVLGIYKSKDLVINMDPFNQFKDSHPLIVANDLVEKHLGPASVVEIMIKSGKEGGAREPEFLKRVEEFQNWLKNEPYIHKVTSIVDILKELNQKLHNNDPNFNDVPETTEDVAQELLFYGLGLPPGKELNNMISINNESIRMVATWNIHNSKEANEKIDYINSKFNAYGLNAVITGKMPLFHDLTPYIVASFSKSFKIALLLITLIMIVVLRSLKLGLLALIPNLFPVLIGSAIYAILGLEIDIASVLIASVVFGIAVDDSIHFLFEYKKLKNLDLNQNEIFATIMQTTYPSLFNTTLLIVIGFGSFIFANYIPNAKFGISVAFCLTVALIADFIVLPAILMISERNQK